MVEGCINEEAFNYDASANTDDGSCIAVVEGCMDESACNYDELVNTDDGSCEYPEEYYDCDGVCLVDSDGDGVCDALEIPGCTDEEAFNYDSGATENDGSCIAVVEGCTFSGAFNYNEDANVNDGSCCFVSGCTDPDSYTHLTLPTNREV